MPARLDIRTLGRRTACTLRVRLRRGPSRGRASTSLGCNRAPIDAPANRHPQTGAPAGEQKDQPMEHIDETVMVNDASRPDQRVLTRHQIWQGLVMKAEDAVPFVPGMTYCQVIERTEDGFIREIEMRGMRVRERVTFFPETRVRFDRIDGPMRGSIDNIIDEDEHGELRLRFVFSEEQRPQGAAGEDIRPIYRRALENTLAVVRRLVQEGKLP
jgi:hypothetical protein